MKVKTVHRVEVEIDTPTGVTVKKSNRVETHWLHSGYGGSVYMKPTLVFAAEGDREPVDLLNDLRAMSHAILDKLEGQA